MTGLTILDIFISLIFLFLLYSLLATSLVEAIASSMGLRARNLSTGIMRMLNDDQPKEAASNKFKALIQAAGKSISGFNNKTEGLHKLFYQQAAIKYMGKNNFQSKPSYISPQAFSQTLVDMLSSGVNASSVDNINNNLGKSRFDDLEEIKATHHFILGEIQELGEGLQNDQIANTHYSLQQLLLETQRKAEKWHQTYYRKSNHEELPIGPETQLFFNKLWSTSNQDIEKFQVSIQGWYQEYTERISGWYKRKVSLLLFFIGFIIAVSFNVDTIRIAKDLADNEQTRAAIMENVTAHYSNYKATKFEDFPADSIKTELAKYNSLLANSTAQNAGLDWRSFFGYLITAFAISLGAPFWFDLLNKLMKLRTSIKPKDQGLTENTQATSNQPKAVG